VKEDNYFDNEVDDLDLEIIENGNLGEIADDTPDTYD